MNSFSSPDAAFLFAIRQAPDDDAPRLEYADWLAQHGDYERAEFIRLECSLAQAKYESADFQLLVRRSKEILDRAGQSWVSSLNQKCGVAFHRGFLQAVNAKNVVPFPLEELAHVIRGRYTCWLASLQCDSCPFTHGMVQYLAALPSLAYLEELTLNSAGIDGAAFALLTTSPHLTRVHTLWMNYNPLGDEGLIAWAESPYLRGVRAFSAVSSGVGNEGILALAGSPNSSSLWWLNLALEPAFIGPWGAAALANSPYLMHLKELDLEGHPLGPDGGEALGNSVNFQRLEQLTLTGCALDNAGVTALARSPAFPRLWKLDLEDNHLSDAALVALAHSTGFDSLKELWIAKNPRIGAVGQIALANSTSLRGLQQLTLDRLASDEVAQAFLESTLPLTYLAAPGSNETISEPLLGALSERFDFRCLRHPEEQV